MKNDTKNAARRLLGRSDFLTRASRMMTRLGLVGEKINALVLFIAMITKALNDPISIIVKGSTSSGKSNLVKGVLQLMPPESVQVRSSLSKQAMANTAMHLAGTILYFHEYRGGREAAYLTRLAQSEGTISRERTVVKGTSHSTAVSVKKGTPVVITTTTDHRVFADDETRFLSIRVDESPAQTAAVVKSVFATRIKVKPNSKTLKVWREAVRLITTDVPVIAIPDWLRAVAEKIPTQEPRARRDATRFLSLLQAVALCRSYSDGRREQAGHLEIDFADYCVAHRLFQRAFTSTLAGVHTNEIALGRAVRTISRHQEQPVTFQQLAEYLGWNVPTIYKWAKVATMHKVVRVANGTAKFNRKSLLPGKNLPKRFLPSPRTILRKIATLPESVAFVDPLTGEEVAISRCEQ